MESDSEDPLIQPAACNHQINCKLTEQNKKQLISIIAGSVLVVCIGFIGGIALIQNTTPPPNTINYVDVEQDAAIRSDFLGLYTSNPEWRGWSYGSGTFEENGSPALALTMVCIDIFGSLAPSPNDLITFAQLNQYDEDTVLFLTQEALEFGLVATQVQADEMSLRRQIVQNIPLIAYHQEEGYCLFIDDINRDSLLVTYNPSSQENFLQLQSFSDMLSQPFTYYAYTAA